MMRITSRGATPEDVTVLERSLTLVDVVRFVRGTWKVLVGAGILVAVLAGGLGFFLRPMYRATVTVTPTGADEMRGALSRVAGSLGGLASLAGVSLQQGSQDKEEALAILKSRVFAEGMIRDQNLLPLFFSGKWNAQAGKWRASDPREIPTMQDGYEYFNKRLRTVVEDRDRGLITLSVEWRDRVEAAAWANQMIARVNEQLRVRRLSELDQNIDYLNRELEKTGVVELRTSLYKLIEAQINERMVANGRKEYAFRVIDPATAPDVDRFFSPRKALMAALGFAIGLLMSGTYLLMRRYAVKSLDAGE